jgi:para-aminobenzoate synthetase
MRTLVIDNYDSFTYNLAHYLAEVTGVEPVVARNDDPALTLDELDNFDNVVLSPGPGAPRRAADVGFCAEVIRAGRLPVLGVCLGHQGICHELGGTVGPAPEVRHGRTSAVWHTGADVLAGLPSPFDAVRYHSLAVTDLPAELEAIAHSADGVLMAVRHRDRPLWGVQFHPESICTEHGHRLLANFTELSGRWHAANNRPPHRSERRLPHAERKESVVHRTQRGESVVHRTERGLRVRHRRLDLALDPEVVFDACYRDSAYSFWLDSSRPGAPQGRFSFMGDAAGPLARVVTADVWEQRITVESADGVTVRHGSFFDWLDEDLAAHRIPAPDLPFDFALGWIGYLGYELKAESGGDRAHRSDNPDAAMLFADRAIAFDHHEHAVYLLALTDDAHEAGTRRWLAETGERLASLVDAPPPTRAGDVGDIGELVPRHDRERYLDLIDRCQREIDAGETYEVCLTNMLSAAGKLDPWQAYRWLRADNPAPFAALLRFGLLSVLSTSPERFLRVAGDGVVESKPIKGTRPRSAVADEDERLRRDLLDNVKDRAENLMIVDLVRNDLSTCAQVGSVRVDKLFDVESYATVHQLVSTVRARLRPDSSAVRCVRAAFPGGSMTGAPKIRTMQIIDELEAGPRGVYSGALGYFSLTGAADLSIVIRTLVVAPDRVEYGTGGAIVALSDASDEFAETTVKAAPLLRLLGRRFPGGVSHEVA